MNQINWAREAHLKVMRKRSAAEPRAPRRRSEMECPECGAWFQPIGGEKLCSDACRNARIRRGWDKRTQTISAERARTRQARSEALRRGRARTKAWLLYQDFGDRWFNAREARFALGLNDTNTRLSLDTLVEFGMLRERAVPGASTADGESRREFSLAPGVCDLESLKGEKQ